MERRRPLDSAGGAGIGPRFILASLFLALGRLSAAEPAPGFDAVAAIRESFAGQRWQNVVEQARALPGRNADAEFYCGVALAQLGRWLCDAGVQAKLRVLGVGFVVVYGKDLRSGNNAFYLMSGR